MALLSPVFGIAGVIVGGVVAALSKKSPELVQEFRDKSKSIEAAIGKLHEVRKRKVAQRQRLATLEEKINVNASAARQVLIVAGVAFVVVGYILQLLPNVSLLILASRG